MVSQNCYITSGPSKLLHHHQCNSRQLMQCTRHSQQANITIIKTKHTDIPKHPYQRYQLDDGDALTGRVLVAEPANPVRRNNQLGRSLFNFSTSHLLMDSKWRSHLDSFVKPAIATVEPAARPRQHLLEHLLHTPANNWETQLGNIWSLNERPGLIWGILRLLVDADNEEGGGDALEILDVHLARCEQSNKWCEQSNGERMPLWIFKLHCFLFILAVWKFIFIPVIILLSLILSVKSNSRRKNLLARYARVPQLVPGFSPAAPVEKLWYVIPIIMLIVIDQILNSPFAPVEKLCFDMWCDSNNYSYIDQMDCDREDELNGGDGEDEGDFLPPSCSQIGHPVTFCHRTSP